MRPIAQPLAEIIDELLKRVENLADPDCADIRRMNRADRGAQRTYLALTKLSDEVSAELEELRRKKTIIDSIRGAIALGGDDE